jgi:hypothetical protein
MEEIGVRGSKRSDHTYQEQHGNIRHPGATNVVGTVAGTAVTGTGTGNVTTNQAGSPAGHVS